MYTQRDSRWKSKHLGFGEGSIGEYGCYLVELCNGIKKLGHNFTPNTLNGLLKSKNLFTGEFKNYIDVANLSKVLPSIFEDFWKLEPWDDMGILKGYLNKKYVVLGKVSATPIGGSGTHFVGIYEVEGVNAIIHDPWTGEYQPVSTRYNNYGNIKGLRVFKVREAQMESVSVPKTKFEELVTKSSKYDEFNKEGFDNVAFVLNLISDYKQTIKDKNEDIKREEDRGSTYRDEYKDLIATLADENHFNTTQDPQEIISRAGAVGTKLTQLDDLQRSFAGLQTSSGKIESDLKAEIAVLKEQLKQNNVLEEADLRSFMLELIRRLKRIIEDARRK